MWTLGDRFITNPEYPVQLHLYTGPPPDTANKFLCVGPEITELEAVLALKWNYGYE